jgi:hypothetical protein
VRFTPTDRYTNMRFVSYEGETPNAQGLQTLGWGCITPTNSANGAQLCTDDRWAWIVRTADGPAVFVASHVASTGTADGTLPANVSFVVRNAFTISGLPATSTLQFASRAQDGPEPLGARVLAEAVPPPDPTGVYTTLVQAWELTADGTQLTARGTRGLQVEDPCAATGGKTLSWCTTK